MKLFVRTATLTAAVSFSSSALGVFAPSGAALSPAASLAPYDVASTVQTSFRPVQTSVVTVAPIASSALYVSGANLSTASSPSSAEPSISMYTTEVVRTSVSICSAGERVTQSGSATVLTSASPTTLAITITSTIPRTSTATLASSSTALRSDPANTGVSSTQAINEPTSSWDTSTTTQPTRSPQIYTLVRLTTSLCSAGQTVNRQERTTALPTPSFSTYESTSIWTRYFGHSSSASACSSNAPFQIVSGPAQSYVPAQSSPLVSYPNRYTVPARGISNSPQQSSQAGQSSVPLNQPIPVSGASLGAISALAPVNSSPTIPTPADSVAPYPSAGSSISSANATGTGTHIVLGPSSTLSPYNPSSASVHTSLSLALVSACLAMAIAMLGLLT